MVNILIYNEFDGERRKPEAKEIYPDGIHICLKNRLDCDEFNITTITLDNINQITEQLLANTDVIIWWGHCKHDNVPDDIAKLVHNAVLEGMGAIFLHSAHHSKPFKMLMGTSCNLTWREDGDYELLWVCNPSHMITRGVDRYIKLEKEETYGEPFGIPEPDELVFIGSYEGGEAFRAGCCYKREHGRVFYFQPGHETYPTFKNDQIIKVIKNAVRWATPTYRAKLDCPKVEKPKL